MKYLLAVPLIAASLIIASFASGQDRAEFPNDWTTVLSADIQPDVASGIEGLTGTDDGLFYVADRTENVCNIWEIDTNVSPAAVANVGAVNRVGCRPSGLAFGPDGALYITTGGGGGFVFRQELGDSTPAGVYAAAVPGANGLAFVGGTLYVTDGTTNEGRVWQVGSGGGDCAPASLANCAELFRVQAQRNGTNLGGNVDPADQVDGVGSVRYTVPRHNTDEPDGSDRQDIVANGIAFSRNGKTAYVADTSRGAIWRAELSSAGELLTSTGCDPTFHENTLCMDALWVAHPLLEGIDGIALLDDGTIVGAVNERNAIVSVSKNGHIVEAFVNPADDVTLLRNGDPSASPPRPMEFPTSPFVSGSTFCTTGADSPRRDNNPNGPGEGPKVTCLNQALSPGGTSLPVG